MAPWDPGMHINAAPQLQTKMQHIQCKMQGSVYF